MHQRIQQSSAFDVMSVPNRQSADQWEAMEVLTVGPANRSSTLTEAERQRILRHQLMIQQGGSTTTALEAAQKLQIERQLQLAKISAAASSASARPVPSTRGATATCARRPILSSASERAIRPNCWYRPGTTHQWFRALIRASPVLTRRSRTAREWC